MNDKLKCFGKSWCATAIQCRGGLDPSYRNPSTGTHKRDQCVWYAQCAHATNLQRTIPVSAVHGNMHMPTRAPTTSVTHPWAPQPTAVPQPMAHQPYPAYMMPPHQAYWGAPQVPMPYQQPGAQMPGYLTHPEPVVQGIPWYLRLLHEIVRSVFKGAFHTGASFFDHMTFVRPPTPAPTAAPVAKEKK